MKKWVKTLVCIVFPFCFLFLSLGYATLTDALNIIGNVHVEGEAYDVYITDISPESSSGVTITNYFSTVMSANVTGRGTGRFTVTVYNRSDKTYLYERFIDGAEADVEGIYKGTDIVPSVSGIVPLLDELRPQEHITFTLLIANDKGVTTDNFYLKFNFIEKTGTEILPGGPEEPTPTDPPATEPPPTEPSVPDSSSPAPTEPEPTPAPTDPPGPSEPVYHDKFLGLVDALLSDTGNCLNDSDLILDAVLESLTSKKRPKEDAPILHCDVSSISGGTMGAITEHVNGQIADDNIDFIFEAVDDNALKESRLILYMYYGDECISSNTGKEIMVYRQVFTRGKDGIWFADGTYIGRAEVGYFFGGGNSGKDVLTVNPYSWKAGYP